MAVIRHLVDSRASALAPPEVLDLVSRVRARRDWHAQTLFVDDATQNVEGARSVGLQGIQFTAASDLEHVLQQCGLL